MSVGKGQQHTQNTHTKKTNNKSDQFSSTEHEWDPGVCGNQGRMRGFPNLGLPDARG